MNEITFELSRFALNMHSIRQQVAASNIANQHRAETHTVDFSQKLSQLENLSSSDKLLWLKDANQNVELLLEQVISQEDKKADLGTQTLHSTQAQMDYQLMVETLNRKMKLMEAVVAGGRR